MSQSNENKLVMRHLDTDTEEDKSKSDRKRRNRWKSSSSVFCKNYEQVASQSEHLEGITRAIKQTHK